jgi:uncharacterized membrane protein
MLTAADARRSMTQTSPPRRWYHPRGIARSIRLRPRVLAGTLAGLAVLVVLPASFKGPVRDALAWNVGGVVYLALSMRLMLKIDAATIKARAARADESGYVILGMVVIAMMASFAAISGLASEAKAATWTIKLMYLGLAATTVVIAWTVTQVVFAIHYAHLNYSGPIDDGPVRPGLAFPGDDTPDYWDFLYFSTSIGATSQTSDVSIRSKTMRRLVTIHSVVSFFFNTMVLAVTINIAAGLI